jgi:hypothetical protein
LRSLTLVATRSHFFLSPVSLHIPNLEAAPNLKAVRLDGAEIRWESLRAIHLRVLSIKEIYVLQWSNLREVLPHMQQLEVLELSYALPMIWPSLLVYEPKVTLPSLTLLKIEDRLELVCEFMVRIQLDISTRMHLVNTNYSYTTHDLSAIAKRIKAHLDTTHQTDLLTLSVHQGFRDLTLRGWSYDAPFTSPPLFELTLQAKSEHDASLAIDAAIRRLSSRVRRLRIYGTGQYRKTNELISRTALAALSDVRSFTVTGEKLSAVTAVLRGDGSSSDTGLALWPALEYLDVSQCLYGPQDTLPLENALTLRTRTTGKRLAILCVGANDDKISDVIAEVVRRERVLEDLSCEFDLQRMMEEIVEGKCFFEEFLLLKLH